MLIYTALYMPYKVAFLDDVSVASSTIDWLVDSLFMVDILINFLSAYEEADGSV